MHCNCVQVPVCFLLFFGAQLILIDARPRSIRQTQNPVLNESVQNISGNGSGSANIVLKDETILLLFGSDIEVKQKLTKRNLPEADVEIGKCKLEKCTEESVLEIGGDAADDSSFEMAESHIFRPLFRPRIRKSSNGGVANYYF